MPVSLLDDTAAKTFNAPRYFTPDALATFEGFNEANEAEISIEVYTSTGDSDTAFVKHYETSYLTIQPVAGGFDLGFDPDEPSVNFISAFAARLVEWKRWSRTFATIETTLAAAESFVAGIARHSAAMQAIVNEWAGDEDADQEAA